jgi:hypothetical protein
MATPVASGSALKNYTPAVPGYQGRKSHHEVSFAPTGRIALRHRVSYASKLKALLGTRALKGNGVST